MTVVRQRAEGDCGVAALAMLAEVPYEDAYVAVSEIDPVHRGRAGLHNCDLVRAAARLGVTLLPTRRYDLDEHDGILRVRWNGRRGKRNRGGHFITIRDGRALCPTDAVPVHWSDYLTLNNGRACTLLREVG